LGVNLLAPVLAAEEPPAKNASTREQAAALYDRGVTLFEHADYANAARSFLAADAAAPNGDALRNALSAARRAQDPALVRAVAERGVAREPTDPELAALSRAALADLEPSHAATSARASGAAPATEITAPPPAASAPTPAPPDRPAPAAERAWPRPVFYVGAVATGALVGVTIWSGIDALHARNRLSVPSTEQANDDVWARAHRTDALLASSLIVGAATAYVGLVWVDWSKRPGAPRADASVDRHGAYVVVRGDF
jgi:hypothetical protein